jgi:hypothetical protein
MLIFQKTATSGSRKGEKVAQKFGNHPGHQTHQIRDDHCQQPGNLNIEEKINLNDLSFY